ncbi:MAG TPA: WGR domain-containing protein [Urbifossiella sp.]|nr:WGR domain-containing protein [Urbifossiella sp.]
MDGWLAVAFEAHSPERNHHRRYEVAVGRDLLGDWTVTIRYGRTGQGGQERRYAAATAAALRAVIHIHLLRRLSAPRRIGCVYRLVSCTAGAGLDPADWLPADVMARFPRN